MNTLVLNIERKSEALTIVHFEGGFDGHATKQLGPLSETIKTSVANTTFIFDLSKLNFLNSYAIGHLVEWHNQVSQKQGQIIVAGASKSVSDIFDIVGIQNIFKNAPDLETAMTMIG